MIAYISTYSNSNHCDEVTTVNGIFRKSGIDYYRQTTGFQVKSVVLMNPPQKVDEFELSVEKLRSLCAVVSWAESNSGQGFLGAEKPSAVALLRLKIYEKSLCM